MEELVAHIDGSSQGNPGPSGIGVVIEHGDNRVEISQPIGAQDNNYAEYAALHAALCYAVNNGCTRIRIYSDSEVVVRQINGSYECRSHILREIHQICLSLKAALEGFTLTQIKRDQNKEADQLARVASRRCRREIRRAERAEEKRRRRLSLTQAFA